MVCRTTKIGSALITTIQQTTNLTDRQAMHIFHNLLKEGQDARTPTPKKHQTQIDKLIEQIKTLPDTTLTPARRESIITRLNQARNEPIDGKTYYAVKNSLITARRAHRHLHQHLIQHANHNNAPLNTLKNALHNHTQAAHADRQLHAPKPFSHHITKNHPTLPLDRTTLYALWRIHTTYPNTTPPPGPQHLRAQRYNPHHHQQHNNPLLTPTRTPTNPNHHHNTTPTQQCPQCGQYTPNVGTHTCPTPNSNPLLTPTTQPHGKNNKPHTSPTTPLQLYPTNQHHPQPPNNSTQYTQNPTEYHTTYKQAQKQAKQGKNPIQYDTHNALPPHLQHYTFGIELEFDLPTNWDKQTKKQALQNIANQLHENGYTKTPTQNPYHHNPHEPYPTTHQGGWKFEQDHTVDGEIISPIMTDTPETWQTIPKICEIITQNGGQPTLYTGTHIHIGTPHYGTATQQQPYPHERYNATNNKPPTPPPTNDIPTINNYRNLITTTTQHHQTLHHLSTNPHTGQHRGTAFCQPNKNNSEGYNQTHPHQNLHSYTGIHADHNIALNLQHIKGKPTDHIEYRTFDGTHQHQQIQTYIKLAIHLTHHAHTRPTNHNPTQTTWHHNQPHKNHKTIQQLTDTLYTRNQDKQQLTQLHAWIDQTQQQQQQ